MPETFQEFSGPSLSDSIGLLAGEWEHREDSGGANVR